MYFNDIPIKTQDEDLLNRKSFSRRLGKALVDAETKDGYCIGLYGPWGSGKSSIINMVMQEIDTLTADETDPPIVMFFNPWNFSTKEQLLDQYFVMLSDKFCGHKSKEKLGYISKELRKYSNMMLAFGDVGTIAGTVGKMFATVLGWFGKTRNKDNIAKQRAVIENALAKQKCKIIVVIDDIDRLPHEEIKLIFQLVNSVAKFPNTIYLLSFDKEVVVEALSDVQGYDGEKYLEKIVQVPINIPDASNDALFELLHERLAGIAEAYEGMAFEQDRWNIFLHDFASKYICNIRDVIRLTNSLYVKCNMVTKDVNLVDMIAITMIETKIPRLYNWIKENKGMLVGSSELSLLFVGKKESEIAEIYKATMNAVGKEDAESWIKLLKFLFPYFSIKIDGRAYMEVKNLRRLLRVGYDEFFDRYFTLELQENVISRADFDNAVLLLPESDLENAIKTINSKGKTIYFLKELEAAVTEIPADRIETVVSAIANTACDFVGANDNGWFNVSAFDMALYKTRELILNIKDVAQREVLLESLFAKCNVKSVQFLSHFMNIIELAHGRLAAQGQENGSEKVISLRGVESLEKILSDKIVELSKTSSILSMKYARMVLYLYKSLDEKEYRDYMNEALKDDLNKLRYVSFSVHQWRSGSVISWECQSDYEEFLNKQEIIDAFEKCLQDKSLWSLENEKLHQVIAFRYWNDREEQWHDKLYDDEIVRKIEELKKTY